MLTERQINIVVFLINADDWVTSDRLSASFHLNKKTIQTELKEISINMKNAISIISNKHHGYRINQITEEGLQELVLELNQHENRNCLPPRQSAFVLYLLYLKTYITMQNLADIFFMSKTAVSLEINVIKRWIDRYEGLSLEISNKNGIMIHASEGKKRIYCSKHGTLRAFFELPFPDDIKKKYEELITVIKEILVDTCIDWNDILTGEEIQKITQFLASSILRTCMGYPRTEILKTASVDPIFHSIGNKIKERLNYQMSETELTELQLIWSESNAFSVIRPQPISEVLSSFINKMFQIVGIHTTTLSKDELSELEDYIKKMKLRYQSGDIAINHYNEDIILQYPLEAYLAYRYFSQHFSLKVTKETSFIALYLSTFFYQFKHLHSILFVSDQNTCVIKSIKNIVKTMTTFSLESTFNAIPVYQYQKDPLIRNSYDILLTTDQKTVLSDHNFFLISPIITKEDTLYLQTYIQKRIENKEENIKQKIKERYVKEQIIENKGDRTIHINEIIGVQDNPELSYHTYDNDQLYIGCISTTAITSIQVFLLKESVSFGYKKIKRIVFASFHEGDDHIFLFFETVCDILHQK